MSITRYFDLYLNAGKTIPLVINVSQYDESEEWVFTLYTDTGVKYTPSSGSIVGIKSDGYLIANAGTVDEQGRVVITETQQMTAAAGKAIFELQIDNETHGTANFILLVESDPANNGTVSGSDIGLLRQALNGGLSQDAIDALLACFQNVAWIGDDGQDYYDALEAALNAVRGISLDVSTLAFSVIGSTQQLTATTVPAGGTVSWSSSNTSVATVSSSGLVTSAGYGTATVTATSGDYSATCSVAVTQAELVSIDAVYTQSGTVYDTDSLDSLKSDLVVTAHWDNDTTSTVASADYTLSGTLTTGTSTITVTYSEKTTTFNVTVTAAPLDPVTGAYAIWDARDYTAGNTWTDEINSISATPAGSPAKSSGAVLFDGTDDYFSVGSLSSITTNQGVVVIQASFKLTDLTKTAFILADNISPNSNIVVAIRPQDSVIRVQKGNATVNYSYTADTNWHFLTLKLGDAASYAYIDDTQIASGNGVQAALGLKNAANLKMGAYPTYNGYSSYYLRSLYIYAKTLTDAEIENNYDVESALWS